MAAMSIVKRGRGVFLKVLGTRNLVVISIKRPALAGASYCNDVYLPPFFAT